MTNISDNKTITSSAILIGAASLISRMVGLVRDKTFAHLFGNSAVTDAYYAAFKVPDLIYNLLIVGALTAGFIPIFTKLFYEGADKNKAWKLASNVINIIGVTLATAAALGIIFMPYLAPLIAPGFPPESHSLLILYTRIMFLSPLILGISMVLGGILQSLRQFFLYSLAPIFYNLGIIFGATVLTRCIGLSGLAWGVVLGALLHGSVQFYGAYKNGYRWHWHLDWKDVETRTIGKLMIPRTIGLAVSQINALIVTILASYLTTGSVTAYNYANNLQGLPVGIIGVSFALAVFPTLSEMVAKGDGQGFIKAISATIRQILFLIIPASIILLLLRAQIVRVIYGSGKFDWTATIMVADTLAFFALGLFAQSLVHVLVRGFYALSNTKTPFVVGVIAELASIIAALVLMKPLGVAGLALAGSIGAIINMILLGILLRQTTGDLEEELLLKSIYKISIAAGLMALVVQFLKYPLDKYLDLTHFTGILMQGLISGIVGLLVYAVVCSVLKLDEMMQLKESLHRRWLKLRNVPAGLDEAEGL